MEVICTYFLLFVLPQPTLESREKEEGEGMIRPYFVAREMYDDGIGTDDDDEDHDKDDDDDDHGDDDDIDQVLGKRKQTKKSF